MTLGPVPRSQPLGGNPPPVRTVPGQAAVFSSCCRQLEARFTANERLMEIKLKHQRGREGERGGWDLGDGRVPGREG